MKILDAKLKIEQILNIKYKDIERNFDSTNKGDAGQILERYLGISPGSSTLDFEDGELKTFKCQIINDEILPMETMAITTISKNNIDLYLNSRYEDTPLCKKMNSVLIVPIVKSFNRIKLEPEEWFIPFVFLLNKNSEKTIYNNFKSDFENIIEQIKENNIFHTYNGNNDYLQIRSKDSKDKNGNYHSVISPITNTYYSNKNYAFYLKKTFLLEILKKAVV